MNTDGYRRVRSRLCDLLYTLRMDVAYERASGDRLWYRDENHEVEVLDLVGGFGSLLLGHNPPELVATAQAFLSGRRPIHAQGSIRRAAGDLANALARRAGGDFRVLFANSGAEAVEIAIKHAILESGSRTFIALDQAFHGKTLGALQLTANPDYREGLELRDLDVLRVRPNDLAHLEAIFAQAGKIAGFIFEPIQGEGGVRPITREFAARAAALCAERNAPLIADEIQCGLGRTGTFLASTTLGVSPDYITLSKALGGGLAKISACLIHRERYVTDLDLKHTSTYAEDDYSCTIALKTLDLIDEPLLAQARSKGDYLLNALHTLQADYPGIIADARGRGLMAAIEFVPQHVSPSFIFRLLSDQEDLGLAVAGHLFSEYRIRVFTTLSNPWALRFEPSALIGLRDLDRVVSALRDVCKAIHTADAGTLMRYVAGPGDLTEPPPPYEPEPGYFIQFQDRVRDLERTPPSRRVAWVGHIIDSDDLPHFDPSLDVLTSEQLEVLCGRAAARSRALLLSATDVRSTTGASIRFYAFAIYHTSRRIKAMIDEGDLKDIQKGVQNVVDVARDLGCEGIALGQYTSIITLNGATVNPRGIGISTGNSYPLSLALQAVERAHRERGTNPEDCTLAVFGAVGNIGRAAAELSAHRYRRVLLIGSPKPGSLKRLQELARTIPNAEIAVHPAAVREADTVIAAVNAVNMPLSHEALAENAIVCDLSVPSCIPPHVWRTRTDLSLFLGGLARLPCGEDLRISSWPLAPSQIYGCMAEALLLGFEGVRDTSFTGSIKAEHVRRINAVADRHGFTLADYKRESPLAIPQPEEVHALLH